MANTAKIKVQIQLDEAEAARVLAGANQIANGLNNIANTDAAAKSQDNLSKSIANSIEQYEFEDQKLNQLLRTARALGKDEQFYAILHKKGYVEGIVSIQQMLGMKAKDVGMTKEQIKQLQNHATVLRHESIAIRRAGSDIHLFAQSAQVAGASILGGVLLLSKQYADSMKDANTAIALSYKAEMHRLEIARNAIGEVFAQEAIPFIREATDVIGKAAGFVREHPEVVRTAIKIGEVLIAAGIVGKAISTATRLTADFLAIQSSILRLVAARAEDTSADKQIAAAELMNVAADKQVIAGEEMSGASVAGTGKAAASTALGGLGSFLGSPGGVLALLAASLAVANKTSESLDKLQEGFNKQQEGEGDKTRLALSQLIQSAPAGAGAVFRLVESVKGILNFVERIKQNQERQLNSRTATSPAQRVDISEVRPGSVEFSKELDQMLKAYDDYIADDLALVRDHYRRRQDIVEDELKAIEKENKRHTKNMENIAEGLADSLAKLSRNFERQSAEDERKYLEKRADVLKDATDDILDLERDLQEKLRKMRLEHEDKVFDLLIERDAVGLIREQRRFQREQSEAIRETNEEIARRRQEFAERLAEIDREYAEEKARRLADYQERVKEAQEQAEERREEELERHKEELAQIREQAAEKLAEEDKRFQEERKRRYDQFIQRIRDLDAFYLGERQHEQAHRTAMIADLDRFLNDYRTRWQKFFNDVSASASTSTQTGTVGHRAYGGYAKYGQYTLGDSPTGGPGAPEFVMSAATTRAAEKLLGGRLSQRSLIGGLSNGKGNVSLTLNDHRRFDSRLSVQDRMVIANDTMLMLEKVLSKR